MNRAVGPLLLGVVGLALFAGCGGSGRSQATLSARQVVTALRRHGVPVHISSRARTLAPGLQGVSGPGVKALLNVFHEPGVVATVQRSSPDVVSLVYDTVAHANKRFKVALPGLPVLASRSSRKVIGRCFRVANVVLCAYRSAVPGAVAAGRDLAAEAHR